VLIKVAAPDIGQIFSLCCVSLVHAGQHFKELLHHYKVGDIVLKQIRYYFITDLERYLKTIRKVQPQQHAELYPQFP
jgi:hypothetical protein